MATRADLLQSILQATARLTIAAPQNSEVVEELDAELAQFDEEIWSLVDFAEKDVME